MLHVEEVAASDLAKRPSYRIFSKAFVAIDFIAFVQKGARHI